MVPACTPLTKTNVSVPAVTVTRTTVPVVLGTTVVDPKDAGVPGDATTGAARVNGHSHRVHRNVKAAYGVNGAGNRQRGHVRFVTSAG